MGNPTPAQQQQQQQQQQNNRGTLPPGHAAPVVTKHVTANPTAVDQLVDMGFNRQSAIMALETSDNDVLAAVERLSATPTAATGMVEMATAAAAAALAERAVAGPTSASQALVPVAQTGGRDTTEDAIKQSIVEFENQQIEKAMAASRMTSGSKVDPIYITDKDGDIDMVDQAVLLASLKDSTPQHAAGGFTFRAETRKEGIPAGLQNSGNVCYFNSFVQTYFAIPTVRRAVIEFDVAEATKRVETMAMQQQQQQQQQQQPAAAGGTAATPVTGELSTKEKQIRIINFMEELQKLFSAMMGTKKSFVDPTPLISSFSAVIEGRTHLRLDAQEDVGEVNILFLGVLEDGLKLGPKSEAEGIVESLFEVHCIEYISGSEADGSPFEISNKFKLRELILQVSPELCTVYDSIDSLFCGDVDFSSPLGHHTRARKCGWITRLPPLLMLQENRVHINPNTRVPEKILLPLRFDTHMYMDRFCIANRDRTTGIRGDVSALVGELRGYEAERRALTHFKGQNFAITDALRATAQFAQEQGPGLGVELDRTAVEYVSKLLSQTEEKLSILEDEIDQRHAQIDTAYATQDLSKQEYVLCAAWVHGGSHSSGHYRAFIKGSLTLQMTEDPASAKWFEYNDTQVSEVSEETVIEQSTGSRNGTVSAYYLLYADASLAARFGTDATSIQLPPHLAEAVEADNVRFLANTAATAVAPPGPVNHNAPPQPAHPSVAGSQATTATSGFVALMVAAKIVEEYKRVLDESKASAKMPLIPMNVSVVNFYAFLAASASPAAEKLLKAEVFRFVYSKATGKHNPTHENISNWFGGHDESIVPVLVEDVPQRAEATDAFRALQMIAVHVVRGLVLLSERKYRAASDVFFECYQMTAQASQWATLNIVITHGARITLAAAVRDATDGIAHNGDPWNELKSCSVSVGRTLGWSDPLVIAVTRELEEYRPKQKEVPIIQANLHSAQSNQSVSAPPFFAEAAASLGRDYPNAWARALNEHSNVIRFRREFLPAVDIAQKAASA